MAMTIAISCCFVCTSEFQYVGASFLPRPQAKSPIFCCSSRMNVSRSAYMYSCSTEIHVFFSSAPRRTASVQSKWFQNVGEPHLCSPNGSQSVWEPHLCSPNVFPNVGEPHLCITNGSPNVREPHLCIPNCSQNVCERHLCTPNGFPNVREQHLCSPNGTPNVGEPKLCSPNGS